MALLTNWLDNYRRPLIDCDICHVNRENWIAPVDSVLDCSVKRQPNSKLKWWRIVRQVNRLIMTFIWSSILDTPTGRRVIGFYYSAHQRPKTRQRPSVEGRQTARNARITSSATPTTDVIELATSKKNKTQTEEAEEEEHQQEERNKRRSKKNKNHENPLTGLSSVINISIRLVFYWFCFLLLLFLFVPFIRPVTSSPAQCFFDTFVIDYKHNHLYLTILTTIISNAWKHTNNKHIRMATTIRCQ